ncbi:metal-dependent transcriptional regulator [Amycolatopsis rubida]|uniref:DtxR family transcriptional regulator, Mn-dependent transcriptional regulator n=1 Tax=Amycolatopsis rubida TaxID=112413 RepID=A0A1I5NHJ7_9PSEU|nr:metal-dependent transcriptional regulator [Amycolatopsis rubida]SFP21273.1 DtxR family transcriptional regulator, Mn-dependent transcriptional regulator [Amycolatopsis rubida]
MTARGLINTTEMYLKAAYELEEDGVVPRRARIADRLGQAAPTVSQTVARLERDGLLEVDEDRRVVLSPEGRRIAVRVISKHRLAEVLLHQVIGLDWERVHVEACRWEHVMSETVARRVFEVCGGPRRSPYGAPVPGLPELGIDVAPLPVPRGTRALAEAVRAGQRSARLSRVSERIQDDVGFLRALRLAGVVPGAEVRLAAAADGRVCVETSAGAVVLDTRQAGMVAVCSAGVSGRGNAVELADAGVVGRAGGRVGPEERGAPGDGLGSADRPDLASCANRAAAAGERADSGVDGAAR